MDDTIKKLFDIDSKNIPKSIPIVPLDNVLLLPFGKLPLNVFEERYIKMTLDSLKNHRMIGIIQPKNNNNELFQMGCIGKITSYIETPDYRLVLNLEGVCRFVLKERNLTPHGYYQASIDWKFTVSLFDSTANYFLIKSFLQSRKGLFYSFTSLPIRTSTEIRTKQILRVSSTN